MDGDTRLTYAELRAARPVPWRPASARGEWVPGDRVAILGVNSEPFLVSYFAPGRPGAPSRRPLNTRLVPAELTPILRDAGARWLLADGSFAGLVGELIAQGTPLEGLLWFDPPRSGS